MEHLGKRFDLVAHHTFDLYYFLTRVYEERGSEVRIGSGPVFGPIEGFVIRKTDNA